MSGAGERMSWGVSGMAERCARGLAWAADRINPILVKEVRQALKSRQFVVTFALLLICGWIWSILGLAIMGPEAAYGVHGADMFAGYYVILAFPLLVIVPFGAFRSLAGEQEDRTYELLSITALSPRQIVGGKLASAVVEMLIYLSAISPCLAFTYMLRGVSFPSVLFAVACLFFTSLAFSVIGLLVGTLSSEKHWQVVLSVLLVVGLFLAFWLACRLMFEGVWFEIPFGETWFWQGAAGWMTAYVTYFALVFYAAVARITFESDNRSTRLRAIMAFQHVCCVGWIAWIVAAVEPAIELLLVFLSFAGAHWYVMGALMTGESPRLSLRVRRQLPQSFLGRAFLTWFNPGPATGYMFAACGSLAALVLAGLGIWIREAFAGSGIRPWNAGEIEAVLAFGALVACYLVIYLGLGLLVLRLLRRLGQGGWLLAVIVHPALLAVGIGVPLVIQLTSAAMRSAGYSLLQISNPFWTLAEIGDRPTLPLEAPLLLTLLPLAAAVVFVLNLPGIVREVRYVRIATPRRVAEEDAELHPETRPAEPMRASPWD